MRESTSVRVSVLFVCVFVCVCLYGLCLSVRVVADAHAQHKCLLALSRPKVCVPVHDVRKRKKANTPLLCPLYFPPPLPL